MDPRIDKIFKLPTKIRALILLALVVLVVAAFYFLFYSPRLDELAQLQSEYQTLESQVQEKRRIADNLPKFQEEYLKMQERLQEALTELPNAREIPTLLTSISTLAKDQGMDILRFRPVGEVVKGFYAEVPVQITMTGTYHDAALFFYHIGKLSRIVNISNLSLANPQQAGSGTRISVDCLATTFRFVETATPQQ